MKKFLFIIVISFFMMGNQISFAACEHNWVFQETTSTITDHTNHFRCDKCGETLENTFPHEIEYSEWTYDTPTQHTRDGHCKYCGYGENSGAAHSGGTATCTSGPICSVCGGEYGSANGHKVTSSATCSSNAYCDVCGVVVEYATGHTSESYWRKDSSGHWKECTSCSYKTVAKTSHVDTSPVDGVCDVCSYEMGHTHTLGSWTTSGSSHIQKCTTCSQTVNTHTPSWTYTSLNSTQHTMTCSVCSITATESHTDTAPVDNVCDKCGKSLSTSHEHSFSSVCSICNNYYYGTCTVAGCSETKVAHAYNCSICGTTICPNNTSHTCSTSTNYTNSIKAKGTLLRVVSLPGRIITIIPKTSEITGWEVEEGNITVQNNAFTMPARNVVINAVI